MGTNRTTWDTQDEIKFINNIGTWVPGRKSLNTKLELLENYFKTSKERNFDDIEYIKDLAKKDIDEAVLYILDKKIELQVKKRALIHLNGIIARNYLLSNKK